MAATPFSAELDERLRPHSYLSYANYRHAWVLAIGLAVAIAAYAAYDPVGGRNGGTWVGYGLGAVSAGLIGWLTWYGVRKRSYFSRSSLKGWLSAHVYLGLGLLVLVPLHSGFQFGWNIHTGAFALLCLVVVTGLVGVGVYGYAPSLMTRNRSGRPIDLLAEQIANFDTECETIAATLPDAYARAANVAVRETRIGGSFLRDLSGRDPKCGTARAIETIRGLPSDEPEVESAVSQLLVVLARKSAAVARSRRDLRHHALMDVWRVLHVPLAIGTVAAVLVHVFVVFYYW